MGILSAGSAFKPIGQQNQAFYPPVATQYGDNAWMAPPGMPNPAAYSGAWNYAGYQPSYNNVGFNAPKSPNWYQMDMNQLNQYMPQAATTQQLMQNAAAASQYLPDNLRLDNMNSLFQPGERQRYEDMYAQEYINPAIAQTQADLYQQGRMNSTFGGSQLGSQMAMGQLEKAKYGMDLFNDRFNQLMQARQSYFGGEGGMATTAESNRMQRGTQMGNILNQQNLARNQFNQQNFAQNSNNAQFRANLGMQQQQNAWDRQQGIWDRDQQIWNRSFATAGEMKKDNAAQGRVRTMANGASSFARAF